MKCHRNDNYKLHGINITCTGQSSMQHMRIIMHIMRYCVVGHKKKHHKCIICGSSKFTCLHLVALKIFRLCTHLGHDLTNKLVSQIWEGKCA